MCRFEGQPRTYFDPEELEGLAKSIRKRQLMPALLVEHSVPENPAIKYMLVDGERRWRACQMVGKKLVGVIYDGQSIEAAKAAYDINYYEASVAANFNHSNHTPIETAEAAKKLLSNGRTREDVSAAMNLSPGKIDYHLKLLKLAPGVKAIVQKHGSDMGLSIGQALRLLEYPHDFQEQIAPEIVAKSLDFRQTAHYVRKRALEMGVTKESLRRNRRSPVAEHYQNMQRDLRAVSRRLEECLNFPGMPFDSLFENRSSEDRQKTLDILARITATANRMHDMVRVPEPASEAAD